MNSFYKTHKFKRALPRPPKGTRFGTIGSLGLTCSLEVAWVRVRNAHFISNNFVSSSAFILVIAK